MLQIIKNILMIFIFPFLTGLILRFAVRKSDRAFILTLVLTALAVIMWIAAFIVPNRGDEGLGIIASVCSLSAAGALIAGGILRIIARKRR